MTNTSLNLVDYLKKNRTSYFVVEEYRDNPTGYSNLNSDDIDCSPILCRPVTLPKEFSEKAFSILEDGDLILKESVVYTNKTTLNNKVVSIFGKTFVVNLLSSTDCNEIGKKFALILAPT